MIMSEIKRYLAEHGRVTLGDLAVRFDTDPDGMRGMLDQWARKGRVRRLAAEGPCARGCCNCRCGAVEVYEWIA